MKINISKNYFYLIFFFSIWIFYSCENDITSIQKIAFNNDTPDESTKKLHIIYSDSSYAQIEIYAENSETFHNKRHITKMYDSLRVNFFSKDGSITSTLSALYGEIDHDKGIITVRDSVRLKNFAKNQTLQTEKLIWNQKDSMIYSVSQVIVKTPKGNLYGAGIKTKQDFSHYEILQPKGSIILEKELKFEDL